MNIAVLVIITIGMMPLLSDAYAQSNIFSDSKFNLGFAIQDIRENILGVFSKELKQQAITEHIAEITKNLNTVPSEVRQRVEAKLVELERTSDKPAFAGITNAVIKTGEMVEIKTLVDRFYSLKSQCLRNNDVLDSCDADFKKLERDTNSLQIVKERCGRITITDDAIREPLRKLEEQCPSVKDIPENIRLSFMR